MLNKFKKLAELEGLWWGVINVVVGIDGPINYTFLFLLLLKLKLNYKKNIF